MGNYNTIPYDPHSPFYPSDIRLGTPALTSRGMKAKKMRLIAEWITQIIFDLSVIKKQLKFSFEDEKKKINRVKIIKKSNKVKEIRIKVKKLYLQFPISKHY